MSMSEETTIIRKRTTVWTWGFWLKTIVTLGIYLFWWSATHLEVTDRSVTWRTGLFNKNERTIPLQQVQDVSVSRGFFGQLLGYGTIRIESAGAPETEIVATNIASPDAVRDAIISQLE
jgi:uncharacterized membrane protein YdbT with pleckstrin-like domain